MDIRRSKTNGNEIDIQVIISDICSEIDLDRMELLKLEIGQPGTVVICTSGRLWLTQPGDLLDHVLRTGQAFTVSQPGTILVQGLPRGKALIREPVKEASYHKGDCPSPWDYLLEAGNST